MVREGTVVLLFLHHNYSPSLWRILALTISLLFVAADSHAEEPPMTLPANRIKEMLHRDFGYELDIAGGSGQSKDDPMIINASTLEQASHTELLFLRGLGRGRKVFWRLLETNLVDEAGKILVQRKIETKEFTQDKIIVQTENYYFDRAKAPVSAGANIGLDIAHTDVAIGIAFPSEIGWLHFENIVDYEGRQPGLGYSLAYNAPAFTATVYVYPILNRIPEHESEVKSAIGDYVRMNGEDAIEHQWGVISADDHSFFYFIPKGSEPELSGIVVIKCGDHFIKSRVTFYDAPEIREISQIFFNKLLDIIRSRQNSNAGEKQ